MSISTQNGDDTTYRMSFEKIQNSTEFARHVRFHKFSYVRLVLDIHREGIIPQQLRFDCCPRETGKCTKSPGNADVARGNELLNRDNG